VASSILKDLTLVTAVKLDQLYINDVGDDSDKKVTVQGILDAMTGDVTSSSGALTIGALKVTNGMLAGSIAAAKLIATDIVTVGTIGTGVWEGTVVASAFLDGDTMHLSGAQTVTGTKTLNSFKGTGAVTVTNILDEDAMGTNSATALATQQSIKAYVDSQSHSGITDVTGSDLLNGRIWIGDGSNEAVELALSGDVTMTNAGVTTVANDSHTHVQANITDFDVTGTALADTKIWIGSAGAAAVEFALSGDATMTAGGVVTVVASSATVSGIVELATISEVNTGTDTTRAVTPDALEGSALQIKVDGIEASADVTDTTNVNAEAATVVGTIATGVWEGTAVASAFLDADTAHLGVIQTFSAVKTFSAIPVIDVGGVSSNLTMGGDNDLADGNTIGSIKWNATGDVGGTPVEMTYLEIRGLMVDDTSGTEDAGFKVYGQRSGNERLLFSHQAGIFDIYAGSNLILRSSATGTGMVSGDIFSLDDTTASNGTQTLVGDALGITYTVPDSDTHDFIVDATTSLSIAETVLTAGVNLDMADLDINNVDLITSGATGHVITWDIARDEALGDNVEIGSLRFQAHEDVSGTPVLGTYVSLSGWVRDETAGTEDSIYRMSAYKAGTFAIRHEWNGKSSFHKFTAGSAESTRLDELGVGVPSGKIYSFDNLDPNLGTQMIMGDAGGVTITVPAADTIDFLCNASLPIVLGDGLIGFFDTTPAAQP